MMLRKLIQASALQTWALVVLFAGPAAAQGMPPVGFPLGARSASPEQIEQQQKEERAYNRAMQKVPDKEAKTKDPWGNVRSAPQADSGKKARQ
jgi:hypothetical protein